MLFWDLSGKEKITAVSSICIFSFLTDLFLVRSSALSRFFSVALGLAICFTLRVGRNSAVVSAWVIPNLCGRTARGYGDNSLGDIKVIFV